MRSVLDVFSPFQRRSVSSSSSSRLRPKHSDVRSGGLDIGVWPSPAEMALLRLAWVTYRIELEKAVLLDDVGDAHRSYARICMQLIQTVW